MYTVLRVASDNKDNLGELITGLQREYTVCQNKSGCWTVDVLKDDNTGNTNTWYEHSDAMVKFIQDNTEILTKHCCNCHFDIAINKEDCKGIIGKCLPMDLALIKLLAEYNITFEISMYLLWDDEPDID